MSELQAFEAYKAHVATCVACRPDSGQVCETGYALHQAWRKAASQQPSRPFTPRAPRRSRRSLEVRR